MAFGTCQCHLSPLFSLPRERVTTAGYGHDHGQSLKPILSVQALFSQLISMQLSVKIVMAIVLSSLAFVDFKMVLSCVSHVIRPLPENLELVLSYG